MYVTLIVSLQGRTKEYEYMLYARFVDADAKQSILPTADSKRAYTADSRQTTSRVLTDSRRPTADRECRRYQTAIDQIDRQQSTDTYISHNREKVRRQPGDIVQHTERGQAADRHHKDKLHKNSRQVKKNSR